MKEYSGRQLCINCSHLYNLTFNIFLQVSACGNTEEAGTDTVLKIAGGCQVAKKNDPDSLVNGGILSGIYTDIIKSSSAILLST